MPLPGGARGHAEAPVARRGPGRPLPARGGDGPRHEVREPTFAVAAGGFWQVHPGAPEALVAAVLEALAPQPGESALDLYAGVGLFSRFLLDAVGPGGRVCAVEGDAAAVRLARRNCRGLDIPAGDVGRGAGDGARRAVRPRGARPAAGRRQRKVVEQTLARPPRAVAYVACDPAALARDVATFGEHGYRLHSLRAFDVFPMTSHVECVALLVRTGSDLRRSESR